jgi:protein unc-119
MSSSTITPEQALAFTAPTEDFLCPLTANTYGIEFYQFTIRDVERNKVLFEVGQAPDGAANENVQETLARVAQLSPEEAAAVRTIRYRFAPSFLRKQAIGAKLVFGVNGDQPVPKFRMIERHYFRNALIKSFDFEFGFCIPHSTNTWEAIYDMPRLNPEWEEAIIANPYETASDSFYFVGNQLIMHNKAFYAYDGPEQ